MKVKAILVKIQALLIIKTYFVPVKIKVKHLTQALMPCKKASKYFQLFPLKTAKDVLTHSERRTLKTLRQIHNTIIIEADKAGAVCIIERIHHASKIKFNQ